MVDTNVEVYNAPSPEGLGDFEPKRPLKLAKTLPIIDQKTISKLTVTANLRTHRHQRELEILSQNDPP